MAGKNSKPSGAFRVGDWRVDPAACRLHRDGEEVRLEPKVMDVLALLASRAGRVVTREDLEAEIWTDTVVGYDAVTGAIQKLRRALGDSGRRPRIIETVPKRGYRVIADVVPDAPPTRRHAESAPRPRRVMVLAAIAVLLITLVAGGIVLLVGADRPIGFSDTDSSIPTVAVRPFNDLGENGSGALFADGITDDITTALAKRSDLFVISRDSAFFYRDNSRPPREVAEELGARHLVSGSVRKSGDRLRINVQLIDTASARHLWAETYDTDTAGLFAVEGDIVRRVVSALLKGRSFGEEQDFGLPASRNAAAYENFLIGRQLFYQYRTM